MHKPILILRLSCDVDFKLCRDELIGELGRVGSPFCETQKPCYNISLKLDTDSVLQELSDGETHPTRLIKWQKYKGIVPKCTPLKMNCLNLLTKLQTRPFTTHYVFKLQSDSELCNQQPKITF
jgi:hypothetical protein